MKIKTQYLRWLPALLIMLIIFGFSSIPSTDMPSFGLLDLLVKKGSHMLGYGLLAAAFWYGLGFKKQIWWVALLLCVLYAASDEFHQSFIQGRHPSWVDVIIFDGTGGALALLAINFMRIKKKQPIIEKDITRK